MKPELLKTIKFWLEICAAAYVVVGAILQYSVMAVPFIPTILKYGWPLIAAYAAFRLFQYGRSLNQRLNILEEQAKTHRDSYHEIVGSLQQEIQKRQELEKILRLEIQEREKQVAELENNLVPEKKRDAARERIAELLSVQQVHRSLADMTPGEALALGAIPLKRKT